MHSVHYSGTMIHIMYHLNSTNNLKRCCTESMFALSCFKIYLK